IVQVEGNLRFDEFSDAWRLMAKQLQPLQVVRERLARSMSLVWPEAPKSELLEGLSAALRSARGGKCAVVLQYRGAGASGCLRFGEEWNVTPSAALLEQLEALLGPTAVSFSYARPVLSAAVAH